jgi:MFS family permease
MPEETFQEIGATLVDSLDAARRKKVSARLGKMIDYAIKRQDWYEDQRNRALSLGISLLGLASFLVAGLLSAPVESMVYFRVFAGFTLGSIVLTAGGVILEYAIGAHESHTSWPCRYPKLVLHLHGK